MATRNFRFSEDVQALAGEIRWACRCYRERTLNPVITQVFPSSGQGSGMLKLRLPLALARSAQLSAPVTSATRTREAHCVKCVLLKCILYHHHSSNTYHIFSAPFLLHCIFSVLPILNNILSHLYLHTMAVCRKRKAVAEEAPASKQTTCTTSLKMTKTSTGKPEESKQTQKRRRTGNTRSSTPPPPAPGVAATNASSQGKRKRTLEAVTEQSDEDREREFKVGNGFFKQFAKANKSGATPQTSRFKDALPSPAQTPSKNAEQLFNRLNIRASSPSAQPPSKRARAINTPPLTPESDRLQPHAILPTELKELLSLHSSFLTALSLHSAHNSGSTSAVHIKTLLPLVTANWRKRSVTVNDVRKMLALTSKSARSFVLEDRARAGVFLARVFNDYDADQPQHNYINEAKLNATFETALRNAWADWSDKTPEALLTGRAFVRQLPLDDLKQDEATKNAAPLYSRGQQRLADLKAGQAAAKAETESSQPTATPTAKDSSGVQNRNTSLLDRILAKQALSATLPAGPTRTELERKSALHRVEDVTRVLDMLAAGQPRASFSMAAMVQHLQQSLRTPITREEVERCLGLMATEIMPGFVKVVASGTVKGVVVTKGGKIGFADLKERLANAGA